VMWGLGALVKMLLETRGGGGGIRSGIPLLVTCYACTTCYKLHVNEKRPTIAIGRALHLLSTLAMRSFIMGGRWLNVLGRRVGHRSLLRASR